LALKLVYYGRPKVDRETVLAWARAVAAREDVLAVPAESPHGYAGLALHLHPAAEPLLIAVDPAGERLEGEARTSGAGPGYHELCVALLDEMKDLLVPDLAVEDEGELWETRDRRRLEEHMRTWRVGVGEVIAATLREGKSGLFALPEGAQAKVPDGHVATALGIVALEDWERATEDVRAGRELGRRFPWWGPGKDAWYWRNLAVALMNVRHVAGEEAERHRLERALDAADRALALDPQADLPSARLALAAEQLGLSERALPHLEAAVRAAPTDHPLRFSHAKLLEALGRREEAADAFEELSGRRPKDAAVAYNAGYLRAVLGDYERAVPRLEQAVRLAPHKAAYHAELSVALSGLGLHEEAIATARRAVALEPEMASCHATLAQALGVAGRLAEALAAVDRALELAESPDFRELRDSIVEALGAGPG